MLYDTSKIKIEELKDEGFRQKQISVEILRLDQLHPIVSGNKLFKLHHFLEEALGSTNKKILSFGGAYSNHLVATAFAGALYRLTTIGIVRGEPPLLLSPTLQECIHYGMQLKFISRAEYTKKEEPSFHKSLLQEFGDLTFVPEGGYHPLGAAGAAQIMQLLKGKDYTHICLATGTGTTLAGILLSTHPYQSIIGINVLKGMTDMKERIQYLTGQQSRNENLQVLDDYHFGGYAKKNEKLIQFMNKCWLKYKLPLDFVYTAKMLFAIFDLAKNNYFPKNSKIICIHTGGLQGNRSLPGNTLLY